MLHNLVCLSVVISSNFQNPGFSGKLQNVFFSALNVNGGMAMRLALKTLVVMLISILMWGCSSVQPKGSPAEPAATNSVDRPGYVETGKASFYAHGHQSRKTASGELYDQKLNTAAHRTLPFGARVRVTNMGNGKSIVVKINDRGPFVKDRILDLSQAAFSSIADASSGIIDVKIEVIE